MLGVTHRLLAKMLREWVIENMPNHKKLSRRDITKQLNEIGLGSKRGVFFDDRRVVWGLSFPTIKEAISKRYGYAIENWWALDNVDEANRIVSEYGFV